MLANLSIKDSVFMLVEHCETFHTFLNLSCFRKSLCNFANHWYNDRVEADEQLIDILRP